MFKFFHSVAVLLCLCLASPAFAADGAFTVQVNAENDVLYGTDSNYSNGLQIRFIAPGLWELSLGQNLYTPENKKSTRLQEGDRPYAGYLYASFDMRRLQASVLDTLELSLGVVGPAALGEEVQNGVHKVIDVSKAEGWDNQLGNEPLFMCTLARVWSLNPAAGAGGWGWDVLPRLSASLGTPYTQATAGMEWRFGWKLPEDYLSLGIRPAPGVLVPGNGDFWFYMFAGSEVRAIAWNTFLDGNIWRDSYSVPKCPFVAELRAGFALSYKNVRLACSNVYLTKEFKGQDENEIYNSVTLSYAF